MAFPPLEIKVNDTVYYANFRGKIKKGSGFQRDWGGIVLDQGREMGVYRHCPENFSLLRTVPESGKNRVDRADGDEVYLSC